MKCDTHWGWRLVILEWGVGSEKSDAGCEILS